MFVCERGSWAEQTAAVQENVSIQQNFGKMLFVFGCIGTDLCK